MYKGNKVLCIIPVRGGSKGMPGKNIKELLGKPLIGYTIEQAKNSAYIDRVIVSTEDKQIADIASQFGAEVPFARPPELASDECGTIDVLLHAVDWLEKEDGYFSDILILLHVTTPLRSVEDIDKSVQILVEKKADNVFSVTEAHRNPYFNMVEVQKDGSIALVKEGNFLTRQAAPDIYDMNSSIYVWWKDLLKAEKSVFLKKSRIYIMPKERSIDIDDAIDFKIAEILLSESTSVG